jgi:signal transduction histidine kinase/PAS domain-containing protein
VSLVLPEGRKRAARFISAFCRGTEIEYRETICVRKGGRAVHIAFTAIPQESPAASVGFLIIRDISERKTLETKLTGTLAMLEDANRVARIASWQWDIGKDEVTWSGELNRLLGIDRSIVRATFRQLLARVSPEDRKEFQNAIDRAIHEGVPYNCRHGLVRSGGSRLEVFSQGRLIVGPAPGERRLVGITQDLSKAPSQEQTRRAIHRYGRLAASWAKRVFFLVEAAAILFDSFDYASTLRHLAQQIVPRLADRCGIDLVEADGSILRLPVARLDAPSPGSGRVVALESLGEGALARVLKTGEYELQQGRAKGMNPALQAELSFYALPSAKRVRSILILPLRTRRGIAGAMTLVQAESRRTLQPKDVATFQALARLAGQAVENGQLYRDASDLNRDLEAKVNRRTAELQEALRDLDDYASSVAHDLKAPLRAIRAFTEALAEDFGDRLDDQGRAYVGRICGACARLDVFISDLLAYSRVCRREVHLEPVSLGKLMEEVTRQLEGEINDQGGRLRTEPTTEMVIGNSTLLSQALTNLISNAAKFVAPETRPDIRLRVERRGDQARLWVEDNGIGISPEYLETIFKPFERLHSVDTYSGTGLGLAIVRKAVERMGGRTGAESELGKGSRFWIELPSAPSRMEEPPTA